MNKVFATTFISVLLISALAGTLLVNLGTANPRPPTTPAGPGPDNPLNIGVLTPQNNAIYATNTLTLSFTYYVNPLIAWYVYTSETCQLDGAEVTLPPNGSLNLTGLKDGWHSLYLAATIDCWYYIPHDSGALDRSSGAYAVGMKGHSSIIQFLVDTSPPSISVWSLENKAIGGGDVQVDFRVFDYGLSWVGYSVDGKDTVTINMATLAQQSLAPYPQAWTGNLTLTGLTSGSHDLKVYARDEAGNTGKSETINFIVGQGTEPQPQETEATQPSNPEPFPTTLVIASIVVVAVVSLGLPLYFKKRKR